MSVIKHVKPALSTKMVNARIDQELHKEYVYLKALISLHGYKISLTKPFEKAIKLVNKEIKDKLKELNVDSFKSLEETEGSTLGDLLRAARDR